MERVASITCEFTFEASHQLRREEWSDAENEAVFGSCARLHGHSYRLLITLRGPIDPETGMVRNFRDVRRVVRERVVQRLDHHHLDGVTGDLSTAENLCYWIAGQLVPELGDWLSRVELWETRTACAFLTEEELARVERPAPVAIA
jgi:6-pyruvoyltetrahydropterin/6-carboxytetrahydropterin synthase